MTKRALITGIGGQDGSYLADILLERGYEVHGIQRRSSVDNLARVAHVRDRVKVHVTDVTDAHTVQAIFDSSDGYDEVYHMADQDAVAASKMSPAYQMDVTIKGTLNVLRACEASRPRVFVPISATVLSTARSPQNEDTPLDPRSPYACAKAAAWHLCKHWRQDNGLQVSCGIMFNHDSPRRGRDYLLQRIARGEPLWGDGRELVDIGYAREYMEAACSMLQQDVPDDFVIGTGKGYRIATLRDASPGSMPTWTASSVPGSLVAHPVKAFHKLGWVPRHAAWSVLEMIREEMAK